MITKTDELSLANNAVVAIKRLLWSLYQKYP
jgi:hypothetical protein